LQQLQLLAELLDLGLRLPERLAALIELHHVTADGARVALCGLALLALEIVDTRLQTRHLAAVLFAIVARYDAPAQLLAFGLQAFLQGLEAADLLEQAVAFRIALGQMSFERLHAGQETRRLLRGVASGGVSLGVLPLLLRHGVFQLGAARAGLRQSTVESVAKAVLTLQVVPQRGCMRLLAEELLL
jgi:hypothetical protein